MEAVNSHPVGNTRAAVMTTRRRLMMTLIRTVIIIPTLTTAGITLNIIIITVITLHWHGKLL